MDQKELQEKIAEYYSKLPMKAQELFSSMEWLETLKKISAKYNLNGKQQETLGTETTLLLLGILNKDEYKEVVMEEFDLPVEIKVNIFTEINDSIIKPIDIELAGAYSENIGVIVKENPIIEPVLDQRLEKLPIDIEKIIVESNYQDTVYAIGKENNLTVMQIDELEKATTNFMAGAIHPSELQSVLENNLELPKEKVRILVDALNERLFKKIRAELIKDTERNKIFATKVEEDREQKINADILGRAGIEIIGNPPIINKEGSAGWRTGGDLKKEPPRPSGTPPQKGGEGNKLPVLEKLELDTVAELKPATDDARPQTPERSDGRQVGLEKSVENNPVAPAASMPTKITPVSSMLSQKLSAPSQAGVVKTEHTLENISKTSADSGVITKTKIPNADPYREIPE